MNIKPTLLKTIISILAGTIVAFIISGFIRCDFGTCYATFLIPLFIVIILVYWIWSSFQK